MSFLSELFHGNVDWGNLAPENIFKDTVSSFQNQPEWAKIAEIALPAVALGGVGLGALGAGAAGAGAAEAGGLAAAEGAAAGAPLDILAGGTAAGTAADVGAVGAGGLSALTPADVSFFDPATWGQITGEAAIGPDVTAPAVGGETIGANAGAIPFTDPASMGAQVQVGAPGGFAGAGVDAADWATAAAQPLIPGGGGGGFAAGTPGAVAGGGGATAAVDPAFTSPWGAGGVPFAGVGGGTAGTSGVTAGQLAAPGIMDQLGGALAPVGSALKTAAPWAGTALAGYNLFQGYQGQQALKALQQQEADYQNRIAQAGQAALGAAQPILSTGQAIMSGGPLPPTVQAMFDQFRNAERARVIQGYAARNPGDPNQANPQMNSALAQDLNAVDNNLLAMREKIGQDWINTANSLLTQGVSATNISSQLPIMMEKLDMQLAQITGNSIANFAAAMSGGTMKVAGLGGGQNLNINLTGVTGSVV